MACAILQTLCHDDLECLFRQGIKFYDPQIVGDTPETVEYRGLHNLVTRLRQHVGLRDGQLLFAADGSVRPHASDCAVQEKLMHALFWKVIVHSLCLSHVCKRAIDHAATYACRVLQRSLGHWMTWSWAAAVKAGSRLRLAQARVAALLVCFQGWSQQVR